MNSKNKILIAIGITILIILLLLLAIVAVNKKENNVVNNQIINNFVIQNNIANEEVYYNEIESNQIIANQEYSKVKYVTDEREYFTIKGITEKYIELMGDNQKENLIKLISPNYLTEFSVTKDNIEYNIPKRENYTQLYYLDIENMFEIDISNRTKLYFINANISIKYTTNKYPLNIMIETDRVNLTYNIYPEKYLEKYKLNNLNIGNTVQFNESEILNRDNLNKYTYAKPINDKEMATKLFDDYIYRLKVDSDNSYEKLNKEYAQKRFNIQKLFNQYIEESRNIINFAKINKYKVINKNSYTDYICTDQYNNYYIFRQQNGVMRYSVFLDSYTVELETFKTEYEEADIDLKLSIQLGKIIQMLNTKDYNAIYSKLNNAFKNNNFTDVSKLEEYLKKNTYDINLIKIDEYEENEDYYVCKGRLSNLKNSNENKEINLIIKLIDSNNFEMSFSF